MMPEDLIMASMLGLADRVESILAAYPQDIRGQDAHARVMEALIGGAIMRESPLRAAERRGRNEVIAYLQQHGRLADL